MKYGAKKCPPEEVTDLTFPITESTGTASKKSRSFFQTTSVGAQQTLPGATEAANVAIAHWILANDKHHNTAEDIFSSACSGVSKTVGLIISHQQDMKLVESSWLLHMKHITKRRFQR